MLPPGGSTDYCYKISISHCFVAFQGGHVLTPLPAATPMKPGSAVSTNYNTKKPHLKNNNSALTF